MNASLLRLALRSLAILIAVAAVVDPAWSISRQPPRELVVIDLANDASSSAILGEATAGWTVVPRTPDGRHLPCDPNEHCLVIADGSTGIDVSSDRKVPLVMMAHRREASPNVALTAVTAPAANQAAAGSLSIALTRSGAIKTTEIRVFDGTAVVGTATHEWGSSNSATVEVPWWPIEGGARALRVEAVPAPGETLTLDNVIDAGAQVKTDPVPVLVFDARPSWHSTFVRRALEDDPRFAVNHLARVAPALTVATRAGLLDAETLEPTPVVIAGDPDALTAADAALLDRFVSVRGGTLVLLPEHRVTGPAARFFPGTWSEHLVPAAERAGPLWATEILRSADLPSTATVLGDSGNAASIAAIPIGAGRVVIAGALDAWRHRDRDNQSFNRFWKSTIAQGAELGAALRIDVDSHLATRGTRVPFTLRHHSMQPRSALEARVTAACGGGPAVPVRVWPSALTTQFSGLLAVDGDACIIRATLADRAASATIAVANHVTDGVDRTLSELERAVIQSGGVVVGDQNALAKALGAAPAASSQIVSVHPLRSAWWSIPFALCLTAEWWLRRRAGSA